MTLICAATLGSGDAERLAGARTRPNRSVIGNSGESQGVGPTADAGEKVALSESSQVIWLNLGDAAFINVARSDQSALDQHAQPCRGVPIELVVVGRARHSAPI